MNFINKEKHMETSKKFIELIDKFSKEEKLTTIELSILLNQQLVFISIKTTKSMLI